MALCHVPGLREELRAVARACPGQAAWGGSKPAGPSSLLLERLGVPARIDTSTAGNILDSRIDPEHFIFHHENHTLPDRQHPQLPLVGIPLLSS